MNFEGQNINRVNAVKQLKKGIKGDDEGQILASIANAFVYIGDMIKEHNDIFRESLDLEEVA